MVDRVAVVLFYTTNPQFKSMFNRVARVYFYTIKYPMANVPLINLENPLIILVRYLSIYNSLELESNYDAT